ncbi:MAG TPA: NAD-dependent epimerase/dehydratase family protein [Actinomycetota bacterium]|nr:NAD-dependent epimerase/dehydratase family protein [Actinomycetota bacterium]
MAPRRSSRKTSVAVTGAAGFLAERLLGVLCADDRVERVLGFDVRVPSFTHAKFVFDELDVRDPAIEGRLQGVDVLVHLAFIMDPIRDETFMRDVNVNGSQTVFKGAGRAGVKKLVYTSSAVVYGAHPDNRIPLDEDAPLRANLDFSYAAHKLEVEFVVGEVKEEFPSLELTVLRPAIVFGPHVNNAWSHSLELPVLFGVQGYASPLQFVHEDDVADAIAHAVFNDLPGVYNVAAPGWLEADEMLAILDRRKVDLPEPVAFGLVERLWAAGLAEAPAGMLHYVMHPWIVSTEKLAAAGFTAKHSNLEVFKAEAERAKDHVRIGRRRVSRGRILQGGVAGLGLVGAVAAARFLRRRSLAA